MPKAYYNEWDPYAADWLRNLSAAGHIAPGHVDARSIRDVRPVDLAGFDRVHMFAGIGGWDLALQLAGWPADVPAWTGSCPCQPFSAAGKRGGFGDDRHLWPEFFRLISECRPPVVMGEQVASRDGLAWLDLVHADLEGAGYTVRAADLCAAGIGAPHIRQRLWWVAYANGGHAGTEGLQRSWEYGQQSKDGSARLRLADRFGERLEIQCVEHARAELPSAERGSAAGGFWSGSDWLPCIDGVSRPVERGSFPLVARIPRGLGSVRSGEEARSALPPEERGSRVGRLRGYGNAIVPQVAAAFIRAVMPV